jgi:hypothetical protein
LIFPLMMSLRIRSDVISAGARRLASTVERALPEYLRMRFY